MNQGEKRKLDRVSRAKLGTLWFLPAFSLILLPLALQHRNESVFLAVTWALVGAVAGLVFCWACHERNLARRALGRLWSDGSHLEYLGHQVTGADTVQQYDVIVGLIVLEVQFRTCPRLKGHALFPTLATLLLGWWSLPWGPLSTVLAVVRNLRGGTRRSIASLVAELREPEPPVSPWHRRFLALDSGSVAHVAVKLAVLALLVVLLGLVVFAVIKGCGA